MRETLRGQRLRTVVIFVAFYGVVAAVAAFVVWGVFFYEPSPEVQAERLEQRCESVFSRSEQSFRRCINTNGANIEEEDPRDCPWGRC